MRALLTFCLLLPFAAVAEIVTPVTDTDPTMETTGQSFEDWLTGFRARAVAQGLSEETLQALDDARFLDHVIDRDRNQYEFSKTIWDYLATAVSDGRIANGKRAMERAGDVLARVEAEYGVDRHIIAAIWGLESAYGAVRGDKPTLHALATLAADSRRGPFFEGQLIDALTILQSGDTTPAAMRGSWAGAMGHTQFMPSSYLALAVDFDGDGRRDIWSDDPADALASTANYLRDAGWVTGQPWGYEVVLPEGFDYRLADRRIVKSEADWQRMGLRLPGGEGLPDVIGEASVLLPAGAAGVAFLVYDNFAALERYNTADAYVIAVGHLADRLRGGPPFAGGWPYEDRVLTFDERIELQRLLTAAGFDTFGLDGLIGPNTVNAIRDYQAARGLIPDGYAPPRLLERLRAGE